MKKLSKKAILLLIAFYVLIAIDILLLILAETGRTNAILLLINTILVLLTIKKLIKEGSLF